MEKSVCVLCTTQVLWKKTFKWGYFECLIFFISPFQTLVTTKSFNNHRAEDLKGSNNIHHTQLSLITLELQPHKAFVNCQPVYVGAKASLSIIGDRPFDYIWTSISSLYILTLLPLAQNTKCLTLIAVCNMKSRFYPWSHPLWMLFVMLQFTAELLSF